jgi:hypothetical protein
LNFGISRGFSDVRRNVQQIRRNFRIPSERFLTLPPELMALVANVLKTNSRYLKSGIWRLSPHFSTKHLSSNKIAPRIRPARTESCVTGGETAGDLSQLV